jgi:hypothetical protein
MNTDSKGQALRFTDLPTEILQKMASYLPSASALNVLLVCRRLATVCNDWVV